MKNEFLRVYDRIERPGSKKLLEWMEESGFFEDPASARNHLARPGGLCEHSLNVFRRLDWLASLEQTYLYSNYSLATDPDGLMRMKESIVIVGLLHDLCKIGCYRQEIKNQKTYDPEKVSGAQKWQIKHDSQGDFIWESVSGYKFDDPLPFGHGEKSVWIISKFMPLTDEEAFAIRYHMGPWVDGEKQDCGKAYEMYELAMLLHMADEFATFVDEKGK